MPCTKGEPMRTLPRLNVRLVLSLTACALVVSSWAMATGVLTPAANPPGGSGGTLTTGSVDNAVIRADGAGGATLQAGTPSLLDDTGAYTMQPAGATLTGAGQYFFRYDPLLAETFGTAPRKFNFSMSSYPGVSDACMGGDAPDNHVGILGWNLSPTGRENGSFSADGLKFEHGFCISGVMGHEFHYEQQDSAGIIHRPISIWSPWDGVSGPGNQGMTMDSNVTSILRYSTSANGTRGQQIAKIDTEQTPWTYFFYGRTVTEPMRLQSQANGCPWFQQRNAANSAYINYPCFRDLNGASAGGSEYYFSSGESTPMYSVAAPQTGTTFAAAFAWQSTALANGEANMYIQNPTNATQQWLVRGTGSTTDIIGSSIENTGNGYSMLLIQTPAAGADPFVRLYNNATYWSVGLDNSDSDAFVLSQNNLLGTNNRLRVSTTGALTLGGNCSSSAAPAVCATALAGSVVIAAAGTTVTVDTTAVTANSQIFIQEDSSLGTKLGVTCNTTIARTYAVTARTAATSFVITTSAAPVTNPACLSYFIVN